MKSEMKKRPAPQWQNKTRLCVWLVIGATVLLSACHPSNALKAPVRTENFKFGIIDESGVLTGTTQVPYKWGQNYGWNVNIEPKDAEVHWKEVLTKPSSPTASSDVARNFENVTTIEKDETPKNGIISDVYAIAPGDPKGEYGLTVYVNNRVVSNSSFVVK